MARAGSVAAAVLRSVRAARDAGRVEPHHEPAVAMAVMLARYLDAAESPNVPGMRLLRDMLADLPLRPERTPRGDDRPGDPAAGADPIELELAELVGAGPSVGDAAHA